MFDRFRRNSRSQDPRPSFEELDTGLGRQLRADALRHQFERMGAVFAYDLEEGDDISLGIARPDDPETTTRLLGAELVGRDAFRITEDDAPDSQWTDQTLSFGTYAAGHGPITFIKPGVLRGFIARGGCVTVDLAGRDFFHERFEVEYYPDVFSSLTVNDVEIF